MTNLVGKSAVVAAGAKNLGGLISTSLAEKGVNVAVHYNSPATEPDADKTVAAVQDPGVKAIKVQGDLTKPGIVSALFDAARCWPPSPTATPPMPAPKARLSTSPALRRKSLLHAVFQ
jgi:NAD(P)-dependent dehydrogenase (short-subunit alcohol dehydrogenase family)